MVKELASISQKFRLHLMACGHYKETNEDFDCEICKKVVAFVNIFLEAELERKGKTNFLKLQEDGIIDKMLFKDGIFIK